MHMIDLITFSPSAVQSETCQPWSCIANVHAPLDMCLYIASKSPDGLSWTFKRACFDWMHELHLVTNLVKIE